MHSLNHINFVLPLSLLLFVAPVISAEILTLQEAELIALKDEPGLHSQNLQARSMIEKSISDAQLMDPRIKIGLINMPTDTFNFGQEAMTQLKVSYIQKFPSGDTLALKRQKTIKMSQLFQAKSAERQLTIIKEVRLAFLEIYYWNQAKETILKNKQLFTQLVDIVQSLFSVGRNNQQDLIRAQLGLSRLDDRLAKIEQKISVQRSKLSRWLGSKASQKDIDSKIPLLPTVDIKNDFNALSEHFVMHPKIQKIDHKIQITRKDIQLVNESLNSGWDLNVSYGYRGDDPNGNDRADFISAAATFDLPFFAEKRQDKKRLSKEYEYQSLKSKRLDVIRMLVAQVQQEMNNGDILLKRQKLYKNFLLPQAKQQAEASIISYQSDRGNFADVMRAYMDDLNTHLDSERINIDALKTQAKILYFIPALN